MSGVWGPGRMLSRIRTPVERAYRAGAGYFSGGMGATVYEPKAQASIYTP